MRTMIRCGPPAWRWWRACARRRAIAADPVEQFYAGKTIHLVIGFGPGGGYDVYGRALARYLGRHIPGNPTIVPQNMPGAGSLRSAGWLYTAAAKDGTVIGTFARGIAMDALLDSDNRQFDARKFNWLGSVTNEVSVCAFGRDSGITSWKDMLARTTRVGSSGTADDAGVYANVIKRIFRARLKLVPGYPGTADILLAVERGELGGLCGWSWSTLKSRSKGLYEFGAVEGRGPARPVAARGSRRRAADHGPDQGPDRPGGAAADLLAPDHGAPVRRPARHSGRARAGAARRLRGDDEGSRVSRRGTQLDLEVRPVSGAEIETLVAELYKSPPEIIRLATEAVKGGN